MELAVGNAVSGYDCGLFFELSEKDHKTAIEEVFIRFFNSPENEKHCVLVEILNKSAHSIDFLRLTVENKAIFGLFKSKCKKIYDEEHVFFVEKCFKFFSEPDRVKVSEIVDKYINPVAMHPISIRNAQKSYENMCRLLRNYNHNKEAIANNLRCYLKEVLLDLSIQFSMSQWVTGEEV